jgi:nanoRNase/pAp phosphatase (c-di-AMP/oligoRNAs hydrolase)
MDNAKQQVIDRLKQATNVLVTVSSNPSVDQLAACIGLTLVLNKNGKHATAVFSGQVPSTIEFLQPEKTIEKNTDSLRDFIIALDKSKADKLRYKVEDKVVKIFITPYQTSISEKDLEFSQGDFNVDVVVTLGVHQQADLDQAITSHGRILHDATVISINRDPNGNLGNINWEDSKASSLSELVATLSSEIDNNIFDSQNSTALLTGIVSETNRFSNDKTSAQTMNISARLMTAGANQQLVATKLEPPPPEAWNGENPPPNSGQPPSQYPPDSTQPPPDQPLPPPPADGMLEINHDQPAPQLHIDDQGNLEHLDPQNMPLNSEHQNAPLLPPAPPITPDGQSQDSGYDGQLTANSQPQGYEPSTDPFSLPAVEPQLLNRQPLTGSFPTPPPMPTPDQPLTLPPLPPQAAQPTPMPLPNPVQTPPPMLPPDQSLTLPPLPPQAAQPTPNNDQVPQAPPSTLEDIEKSVHSPHLDKQDSQAPLVYPHAPDLDLAREAVQEAVNSAPSNQPLEPIEALNAQPIFDFHNPLNQMTPPQPQPPLPPDNTVDYGLTPLNMPTPQPAPMIQPAFDSRPIGIFEPANNPPPPVPPPMMPPVL